MSVKWRLADAGDSQKMAQSALVPFMEKEIVRVLGKDAQKGDLWLHWLEASDNVTFSFRDANERIVPGTPAFNNQLRWDFEPLMNWTSKDLAEQKQASELEPFYSFLNAIKMGVALDEQGQTANVENSADQVQEVTT